MSITADINALESQMGVPITTGVFTGKAPDAYLVATPMTDQFALYADNRPHIEIQELRLSLYSKNNYIALKNKIVQILLHEGFTITGRGYLGREDATGYHHYFVDVSNYYNIQEEE